MQDFPGFEHTNNFHSDLVSNVFIEMESKLKRHIHRNCFNCKGKGKPGNDCSLGGWRVVIMICVLSCKRWRSAVKVLQGSWVGLINSLGYYHSSRIFMSEECFNHWERIVSV